MTKIKYIHCFGGSFTEGGGFEFDSNNKGYGKRLSEVYRNLKEENTRYNFSWPGQLQKFVGDVVEVINYGKSGYGNDRIYRILYDIVTDPLFKKEENLFFIEFTGLCRKEFYYNKIKDFIVTNYNIINDEFELQSIACEYDYDKPDVESMVNSNFGFFKHYYKNFIDYEIEIKQIYREVEFFVSYIEKLGLNYYYTTEPTTLSDMYDRNKLIEYGDGKFFQLDNNFTGFGDVNKLQIKDETDGLVQNNHNGFKANKLVAHILFNRMIDDGIIFNKKQEIDWEYYYKVNFLE